jgi:hypothetical protein
MRVFACPRCRNKVYFESVVCLRCDEPLGFDSTSVAVASPGGGSGLTYCANSAHGVCNWLTTTHDSNVRCRACDLNRTIPNLSEAGNLAAWRDLERAKKRLVYSLLRLGLPFEGGASGKGPLMFDFARNTTTGHFDGVITIDVSEADAVERERQRQIFGEPYRTLLGHLRHESGHFYWMVLIEGSRFLAPFRTLFGDERQDYQSALAAHNAGAGPPDWQIRHVSSYAGSHPWEDWAETWAHYLHMIDSLDTAEAEGMEPRTGFSLGGFWPLKKPDVYRKETFDALVERWVPLTISMNSLSRSMGHDEFYPFVITPAIRDKLAFVHRVVRDHS